MSFKPKHLKQWTLPNSYIGETYPDYFRTGFGQSRDSDLLERCNFDAALEALGGETKRDVIVTRAGHWACGWVEEILVHKSAIAKLRIADELMSRYLDYPILDDDSFSELQLEERAETFAQFESDFIRELESVLGLTLADNEVNEAESIVHETYFDDCGYCGDEDAWVNSASLKRFLESYEGLDFKGPVATELRAKLGASLWESKLANAQA
jgi:hypothetical protein